MTRAKVLVHGVTGFTGRLVARALARRGVPFAVGGRSPEKLEALAREVGAAETCVIDLTKAESIHAALEGRAVVSACAGPFAEIGEPMLASAARAGVHYADTTGEQSFVQLAVTRYRATAEASGAAVVPAMAYEIAPADWAAHEAAERVGGAPDRIDIVYMMRPKGGYASSTTRGTKLSMLRMLTDGDARQFVDGALRHEAAAERVARFRSPSGKELSAFSFPSPEAVVVPGHTGAKNVCTFMVAAGGAASALHATRAVLPSAVRLVRGGLARLASRTSEGPEGDARDATFDILAEAHRGSTSARVFVSGRDPYGLTAEIQALYAERAARGAISARGVLAPSQVILPKDALAELAPFGLELTSG